MNDRIEKLKSFLVTTPDDCFLNHALALEYVKIGEHQQALQLFEKNLEKDPSYIATYYHLGKLYERMNEKDKAIAMYETGMGYAKQANEQRTFSELQNAYEDLVY